MATRILLALGSAAYEARLVAGLDRGGAEIVRRCVDVPDLLASAATRGAEVAVVAAGLADLDADVVSRLADDGLAVVAVAGPGHDEARLLAMGAARVVEGDDALLVASAIREVVACRSGAERAARAENPRGGDSSLEAAATGAVVAVWGPAGAPGRSVLALALAAELAALGREALLIDADVYGGTVAQLLGMLDESSGLLAAAREANVGTLTATTLARHCRAVDDKFRVLTGLPRADRWVEATPALIRMVLAAARQLADVTIVDVGFNLEVDEELSYDTAAPRRNGATLEVLGRADEVVVVGTADPVGLSRLIRGSVELGSAVPDAVTRHVVNRLRPAIGWSREEVATLLRRTAGVEAVSWLSDDPAACDRAVVRGVPLRVAAPHSKLAKEVRALAELLPQGSGASATAAIKTRRAARVR